MEQYADVLTEFEKREIKAYDQVFTIGDVRIESQKAIYDGSGFYKVTIGE